MFKDIRRQQDTALRFGFIGNLMAAKGVHILIEAFKKIPEGAAELKIYGAVSSYKSSLWDYEAFLKKTAGRANISFMGGFDNKDISRVLSKIDVLVVPSIWFENSPLVIHEAFLAGVPVIAASIGGMPELINDGENGFCSRPEMRTALPQRCSSS